MIYGGTSADVRADLILATGTWVQRFDPED
jgi:hypothetical protein